MNIIRNWPGAALAAALAAFTYTGAQAADLGGNCCADLEERVAELEATTARKGNRKVSLEVSGHVNQAVLFWDGFGDNDVKDKAVINNTNSESRFRLKGSSKINSDWSAGFLMEFSVGGLYNDKSLSTRTAALYIKSATLGTVWLGEASTATDGIMEISLASSTPSTLGSLAPFDAFVDAETGLGVVNPFDGTRANSVRYITPEFGGFSFSAAWIGNEDDFDVALRYAGEFGQMRVAAGVGYRKDTINTVNLPEDERKFWGGSASIMHIPSGLFLDGQYGNSNGMQTVNLTAPIIGTSSFGLGDAKVEIYGVRGGVERKWFEAGKTTMYAEYNQLKISNVDADPKMYGVGLEQGIDAAAMSLYLSYRHIDLDLGADDSADVVVVGAKIKF